MYDRDKPDTPAQDQPGARDTLPQWLYQRFSPDSAGRPWETLSHDDQQYWGHHAAAVRRAVARNGFKRCMCGEPEDALATHRVDGPCYMTDSNTAQDVPTSRPLSQDMGSISGPWLTLSQRPLDASDG